MLLCYLLPPTLVISTLTKLMKTQKRPNVTSCLSKQCFDGTCCAICELHHVHAGPSSSNWPHLTSFTPDFPSHHSLINLLLNGPVQTLAGMFYCPIMHLSLLFTLQPKHWPSQLQSKQSLRGGIKHSELFHLLCSRMRDHGRCTGC